MIQPFILLISNQEDKTIVENLFKDCYLRLVYIANQIVHNKGDAEDAVMNAFIYISDHTELLHNRSINEIRSLLILSVKRHSIDIYRKNKTNSNHLSIDNETNDFLPMEECDEFSDMDLKLSNQIMLEKALNQLDELYRIPIILKYYHFMRNNEIAEFLQIDINVLNVRLHRAKKFLKGILQKEVHNL